MIANAEEDFIRTAERRRERERCARIVAGSAGFWRTVAKEPSEGRQLALAVAQALDEVLHDIEDAP